MKTLLAVFLAFVVPCFAFAAPAPLQQYSYYGQVLNSVALDPNVMTFTVSFDGASQRGLWGLMDVWTCATDPNNSVTAVTMSCTASPNRGTNEFVVQDITTSSGVGTSYAASWVKDPNGLTNKCWLWRVDVEGMPWVNCDYVTTGGDGTADKLSTWLSFATKG